MINIKFFDTYKHSSGIVYKNVYALCVDSRVVAIDHSEEYIKDLKILAEGSNDKCL